MVIRSEVTGYILLSHNGKHMNMNEEFIGHLMTFDKKGEGEEIVDENVTLQLTDVRKDGSVELAFTDRNERCYLQFKLSDLMTHACQLVGTKVTE